MFYDHFLSLAWADYSRQPLTEFVDEFHSSVPDFRDALPAQAFASAFEDYRPCQK